MNVLIPSAGKRYLHIKYIKDAVGVDKVVTTEINPLAPGIHAADLCYKVPLAADPKYLDVIRDICRKEKIDVIIPLLDLDIVTFSEARESFEKEGVRFLLSPNETIDLAMDKLATFNFLDQHGLPTPASIIATEWEKAARQLKFPVIIKPRFPSKRMAGGYIIQSFQNIAEVTDAHPIFAGKEDQYIFQEFLTGTELTVDFFCDANGKLVSAVPGERLSALTKAFSKDGGAINMGKIFHSDYVEGLVRKATENLRFFGPANFQAYRNQDGEVKITEINPRFTGATVMTRASGRDFFQWSIDLLLGKEVKEPTEDFKDVYMSSWLNPIFFEEPPVLSI
jgi:carbamoyl-phosphate synthase large subunit